MGVPALSIRNLRKTYSNGVEALHGISLDVEQKDLFALLGPNGAGKSTLIGIITSLVTLREGQVEVFGHDVVRDATQARKCIGLVPQEFNFNRFVPIFEIIVSQAGYYGIPRSVACRNAKRLLQQFGLWEKRTQQAGELSGGMKRRLMLARALVHEPKLLILDEPTAGVDLQLRHSLWRYLEDINDSGTTVILTTHYLEEAERLCRNIAIIDQGKIRIHTQMEEILEQLDAQDLILYVQDPLPEDLQVPGYTLFYRDARSMCVEVNKEHGLHDLIHTLEGLGIRVLRIENRTNRLETLFLRLVGTGSE